MAFLFKSGDEIFNEGVDLVKRREYSKARNSFNKSMEKTPGNRELCMIYIAIIDTLNSPTNSNTFTNLAGLLEQTGAGSVDFGLTQIEPKKYAAECRLAVERLSALGMESSDPKSKEEKGRRLIMLAQKYQVQIGNNPLKFNELQTGDTTVTGMKTAMSLQALGYETLASGEVLTDPKKAAEYLQNAYNYRRQAGEDGTADMNLVQSYSKTAKCWICGRIATGEGIHFVGMSSDITPMLRNTQDDIVKSAPDSFETIYVCRACYSAVSRRADAIAQIYHQKAMEEIRLVEARLMAEISEVRARTIALNR